MGKNDDQPQIFGVFSPKFLKATWPGPHVFGEVITCPASEGHC